MKNGIECYLRQTRSQNWSVEYHTHDSYELVYYISGSGETTVGKQVFPYSANNYVLIPPNVPHMERATSETNLCWMTFYMGDNYANLFDKVGFFHDDGQLLQTLEQIEIEIFQRQANSTQMLDLLIQRVEILILRMIDKKIQLEPTVTKETLINSFRYISNYSFTRINLRQLAKDSGYSYDRFHHLFKEQCGYSPKQYIFLQRIRNAQTLLRLGYLPVPEVARKAGFSSVRQFREKFQKYTGIAPEQYQNQFGYLSKER